MTMPRTAASSLFLFALGFGVAAGCGGDSKPAATAPAADAKSGDAAEAKAGEPAAAGDAAKPAGDKVKVVDGKAPGDDRYALSIEPPAEAAAGQEGEVVVRVVPKAPWHMNLDFPTSLKLSPPEGVTLANAEQKKGDARTLDEDSCEFAVKFTPQSAGEHEVTGKFKFAVCQDEACSPVTEEVSFKVAVK